jgi:hypothetical protein
VFDVDESIATENRLDNFPAFMSEVSHRVVVSAESLYEAVALGIATIREEDWVEALRHEYGTVDVSVSETPARHLVQMKEFNA